VRKLSVWSNPRQRWLARVARAQNELTDLQREIDVSMRTKVPFPTMRALTHADVAIDRAKAELDGAAAEIGGIQ